MVSKQSMLGSCTRALNTTIVRPSSARVSGNWNYRPRSDRQIGPMCKREMVLFIPSLHEDALAREQRSSSPGPFVASIPDESSPPDTGQEIRKGVETKVGEVCNVPRQP